MHVFCNWNEHKLICLLRFLHGEMEQRALRNGLLGLIIWWQIQKLHAGGLFPKLAFVFLLKPIVLAHTRYHIFSRKHIIHMRCSFVYKTYDYSTSFLDLNVASKGEVLPSLLSLCLWWRLGCCLWCFWCPGRASWPWWCLALLCRCAGLCYILCCRILCCAFLRCGISLFCILSFSGSWIGFALRCTFSFWSIFFFWAPTPLACQTQFLSFVLLRSCPVEHIVQKLQRHWARNQANGAGCQLIFQLSFFGWCAGDGCLLCGYLAVFPSSTFATTTPPTSSFRFSFGSPLWTWIILEFLIWILVFQLRLSDGLSKESLCLRCV